MFDSLQCELSKTIALRPLRKAVKHNSDLPEYFFLEGVLKAITSDTAGFEPTRHEVHFFAINIVPQRRYNANQYLNHISHAQSVISFSAER